MSVQALSHNLSMDDILMQAFYKNWIFIILYSNVLALAMNNNRSFILFNNIKKNIKNIKFKLLINISH